MIPKLIILVIFLTGPLEALAQEVSDSFHVNIYDSFIKVVSPDTKKENQGIVIQNRTFVKVIGKIESDLGKVLAFFSIRPNGFYSVEVDFKSNDKVYFIPLSPGLPEAELIVGRQAYEVPPQERN